MDIDPLSNDEQCQIYSQSERDKVLDEVCKKIKEYCDDRLIIDYKKLCESLRSSLRSREL